MLFHNTRHLLPARPRGGDDSESMSSDEEFTGVVHDVPQSVQRSLPMACRQHHFRTVSLNQTYRYAQQEHRACRVELTDDFNTLRLSKMSYKKTNQNLIDCYDTFV